MFGSYYFCFVQFLLLPTPKRKKGVTGDAARRQQAIRKRERRVSKTDEERNRRLSTMAQRGQERRDEETEEQRNRRLSAMVQHARERRLNVIEGQNRRQIQTFCTTKTVLYSLFIQERMLGMCPVTLLLSSRE
ncbi:hypothetical protein AVEN_17390-1 [Araneus ventricosus]|uniref:STPR domain-containing protein n=1 Tax=Araneus ventricosus TaxID=182803 RepID=A0A4Y2H2M4_ARAVE|nr:hypothetical protein AVEN_17390-1 [Araneus ventricosus]